MTHHWITNLVLQNLPPFLAIAQAIFSLLKLLWEVRLSHFMSWPYRESWVACSCYTHENAEWRFVVGVTDGFIVDWKGGGGNKQKHTSMGKHGSKGRTDKSWNFAYQIVEFRWINTTRLTLIGLIIFHPIVLQISHFERLYIFEAYTRLIRISNRHSQVALLLVFPACKSITWIKCTKK